MNRLFWILLTIAFLGLDLTAQSDTTAKSRSKFAPDNYNLQFAGNIGFFSLGANWQFFNDRLEVGLAGGFVPKFKSSDNIYPSSLRVAYSSPFIIPIKSWQLKPLTVGALMTRHNGIGLSKYMDTSQYPKGYYWWGVGNRFGGYLDLELFRPIERSGISGLSVYLEASAWDLMIYSNFTNGNDDYFDRNDFWTLGLGVKLYLE